MWARRHRFVSLRDTLRVPGVVRLALQGRGPPAWPPPPCPVSHFALYQLCEDVTVVLNNLDSPTSMEMYVTTASDPSVLRAVTRKVVSAFFLEDEPVCDDVAFASEDVACLQVFGQDGAHVLTAIRGVTHDPGDGQEDPLAVVDVCVSVRASADGRHFEHVSTSRKPKRVLLRPV